MEEAAGPRKALLETLAIPVPHPKLHAFPAQELHLSCPQSSPVSISPCLQWGLQAFSDRTTGFYLSSLVLLPYSNFSKRDCYPFQTLFPLSYLQVLNSNSSHFCHSSSDPVRSIKLLIWLTLAVSKIFAQGTHAMAILGEVVYNPIHRKQHGPEVKGT